MRPFIFCGTRGTAEPCGGACRLTIRAFARLCSLPSPPLPCPAGARSKTRGPPAAALLRERILSRIEAHGPLRVRDFLEMALHDPQEGYYAKGPAIGAEGDFYTASNVSLFPHAVKRFVDAAIDRLGGARVVELGGGVGHLAAHLGHETTLVEPSPGLAAAQRARGLQVADSLAALRPAPTVFLANEVLDALPVHRLLSTMEGMREGYLAAEDQGGLREVPGPLSDPRLQRAADRLAPLLPHGAAAEVNLDAAALLDAMARAGPRGIALFLDYGGAPERLYGEHAPGGTLRGFHRHRVTGPYERPGEQDVTADVDFPWVTDLAREAGWTPAGWRAQGEFLADLGLVDDLMGALQRGDMQAYLAGKNLLMPTGMGERFQALCLARDAPTDPPLPGFRPDLMPGPSRR